MEQLTEHIWNEQYLKKKDSFPEKVAKAHLRVERQKNLVPFTQSMNFCTCLIFLVTITTGDLTVRG
ncbi:hypothetical protein AC068_13900 [Morganella morganii]|nr:hypothetical protein AC068_13900 [Morganella morganii]